MTQSKLKAEHKLFQKAIESKQNIISRRVAKKAISIQTQGTMTM